MQLAEKIGVTRKRVTTGRRSVVGKTIRVRRRVELLGEVF